MNRIKRLPDEVIARIAAGEVVVRPSHAVKELIENSLDAGSSSISLQLKHGGLKGLQIIDNGYGIDKADFPLLCERFTTSKLRLLSDIDSLKTFGFRGEALASISYVSRLSITSMTDSSSCAFTASFIDGKIISDITPVAANQRGTIIKFSDLFYNMPARLRSLGSSSEEYSMCLELVQKYCIEFYKVGFSVRKFGNTCLDLRTPGGDNIQREDVIQLLYGRELSKDLIYLNISSNINSHSSDVKSEELSLHSLIPKYNINLYMSNLNYRPKKSTVIIFINQRLVSSSSIKQAIDMAYQYTGTQYWVFISIKVPPETIDPNVHPTKSKVQLTHDVLIAEIIQNRMIKALQDTSSSRSLNVNDLNSFSDVKKPDKSSNKPTKVRTDSQQCSIREFTNSESNVKTAYKIYSIDGTFENKGSLGIQTNLINKGSITQEDTSEDSVNKTKKIIINKNNTDDSIDTELTSYSSSSCKLLHNSLHSQVTQLISNNNNLIQETISEDKEISSKLEIKNLIDIKSCTQNIHILYWCTENENSNNNNETKLVTQRIIKNYWNNISEGIEDDLARSLSNSIYIGLVKHPICLVQAENELLLVNTKKMANLAIIQSIIDRLGRLPTLRFNPPIDLREIFSLMENHYNSKSQFKYNDNLFSKYTNSNLRINLEKSVILLNHYSSYISSIFGIYINVKNMQLETFPLCFGDYLPNIDMLPNTLYQIISLLDTFYDSISNLYQNILENNLKPEILESNLDNFANSLLEIVKVISLCYISGPECNSEHLFQAIKRNNCLVIPSSSLDSTTVIHVTSLEKLYRVFERC
ncbi:DNA mismatch repair protein MutL, putative [Cryptosporidium muris RN66]|uniref:DNA mismatch repair protein MutL, putative n=1 Tax=Cryptosporidium muris (strain RN66) TaxID=441375 RepID=B6A9G5_CRYMR|nr:DNA mismatch repair protein MutL, putative [Cryptosporidium muris RN66]EEA04856.1 DNA mismatch repair protein MutL, putative [Cryptosporidium muris RN66]|eukprot:XP_002139205.1 DNA mismatch repair protein MutL [Cryptosporidium muris RN66]